MTTVDLNLAMSFRDSLRACRNCELGDKFHGPVPWSGPFNPTYALMGEAPGKTEDEKGRPFCIEESQLVLRDDLRWIPIAEVQVGDYLIAPDEFGEESNGASGRTSRRWRRSLVLAKQESRRETRRVVSTEGELLATGDHQVLTSYRTTCKTRRWLEIDRMTVGSRKASSFSLGLPVWSHQSTYDTGYLAGFFDGEGHLGASQRYVGRASWYSGFAQNQGSTADRAKTILTRNGFRFASNGEQRNNGVICERIDIRGGFREVLRFLGTVRPERLVEKVPTLLDGSPTGFRGTPAPLLAKESIGERNVVDITTSTGTFLAQGFVVHNCGDSGAILRHWLRQADYIPHEMAVLNTVSCYPNATPSAAHIKACRGWMNGQLEFIRPKVLITLGVVAYKAIRNGDDWPPLKAVHGKPFRHPVYSFAIVPTYHPASYLRGRNKEYERKITEDLAAAKSWWERYDAGEPWPSSECSVCGGEFYRWDEWAMPLCYRHAARQQILFPEDA